MAGFTIVNLKDVEDSAVRFGHSPSIEARFAADALDLERSGLSYQRLAPSFRMPWGHTHREQEEVYVVLSGGMRAKLAGEVLELGALDALRVPPEIPRSFEAGPDGVEFLVFGAPRHEANDAEPLPNWWSD